ncbi:FMN-binding split barrel [Olea europaea subsp. europaea]|uniref:FMN-binding split barrel n=1 Tax=Olea europaea subsp. europaea TaxID=158383 RepID=A0A8S0S134_OLEEU|nr:FMN-binding split barrel [Olea europaea subsp. europaea]
MKRLLRPTSSILRFLPPTLSPTTIIIAPTPLPHLSHPPSIRRRLSLQSMAASSQSVTQDLSTHNDDSQSNVFQLIQAHQEKAARLPPIEEVRTLLDHSLRGILSTFSQKHEGYPSGSMVDFACDAYGSPILALSNLAVHAKDLLANPKCSLLVAKDPEDRSDLVITVHGDATPVDAMERDAVRSAYLAKHPNAFWVDFGDFQFLRIEPKVVRYVTGVATALLGSGGLSIINPFFLHFYSMFLIHFLPIL